MSENLSPAQNRSNQHPIFPEVDGSLLAEDEHPLPEVVTPLDVETVWCVPRSSQKKQRALGTFAPHYRVGRRVYYGIFQPVNGVIRLAHRLAYELITGCEPDGRIRRTCGNLACCNPARFFILIPEQP